MAGLTQTCGFFEGLPLAVFDEICEHLADGELGRRSLFALGSTSRRLLSATARFKYRSVELRYGHGHTLRHDVDRWQEVLKSEELSSHVRRLVITEPSPSEQADRQYSPQSDDGCEDGDDPSFWTRLGPAPFLPHEPVQTENDKARAQEAWASLVGFIATLTQLRDVVYRCEEQLPASLLSALHQHPRTVSLHVHSFGLRSLYQPSFQPHNIDVDEYLLATSPCLSSIRIRDAVRGVDTRGRISFNEDAVWRMVEGCAPNLKSVSVLWIDPDSWSPEYNNAVENSRPIWRGFFPGRSDDTSQGRGRGTLEILSLRGNRVLNSGMISTWHRVTDFSLLRSLHLRASTTAISGLESLSEVAEADGFRSLQNFSLWTGLWRAYDIGDLHRLGPELTRLIRGLRPLWSLELEGVFFEETFNAVLSTHGSSLRQLKLTPSRDGRVRKPFILTRARVEAVVQECPNLTDLELLVQRSNSDEVEFRTYRALAELRHVDHLRLTLDCSDLAAKYEADENLDVPAKYIRETLINSAVDATLAGDIFGCLSLHRSPRSIELWLDGVANFGTEGVAWELLPVIDLLPQGWVRTLDGVGRRFSTTEVARWRREEAEAKLHTGISGYYGDLLRSIWPDPESDELGVWRGKWKSSPLWTSI